MVGTDEQGDVTARKLLRAMAEVADGMAEDGLVGHDAVRRYLLPVYARTVAEARALVERGDVPFTEVECRTDPVANPYFAQWQSDGDAAAYATAYACVRRAGSPSPASTSTSSPGSTTPTARSTSSSPG